MCSLWNATDRNISENWKETLRLSNIHRGSLLHDDDLSDTRVYLQTLSVSILTGIALQMTESHISDSIESKIDKICMRIRFEAHQYETLPLEEKNAFLHWMDPENYPIGFMEPVVDPLGPIELVDTIPYAVFHRVDPILFSLDSMEELQQLKECNICFEEIRLIDMDTTSCHHSFCHPCIKRHLQRKTDCPNCRTPVRILQVRNSKNYTDIENSFEGLLSNQFDSFDIFDYFV